MDVSTLHMVEFKVVIGKIIPLPITFKTVSHLHQTDFYNSGYDNFSKIHDKNLNFRIDVNHNVWSTEM